MRLDAFVDRYLYVSRKVDGQILSLLDDTRETVNLYQQLERTRGRVLFEFGLIYVGFALILILAAVAGRAVVRGAARAPDRAAGIGGGAGRRGRSGCAGHRGNGRG